MKNTIYTILILLISLNLSAQLDRSQMPKPGPAPEIKLEDPGTFEMANGLKVMVVENSKLPRVSITLLIDNPPIAEGDKAGVSTLMGSLLGNGSTSIPKDDFNEEIDFMGARMSFSAQNGSASSLSKYFSRIIELMADAAINPNFTQEEFDKEKAKLLTALKSQEKNIPAVQSRVQNALAYGVDHPYGEFITEASIGNVTLEDVKTFYLEYFVPANAYLVVIGDVQFEQVEELVNKYFSYWVKASPLNFGFSEPVNTQYTQINFVDMPNAVQSEISIQNLVNLKMNDSDYLAALLANRILGGGGHSRLFNNVREDKGYTYDIYSSLGNDKYVPAMFRASTSVRNAVTDSTVIEIAKEIDKIIKEQVTEEELRNAKAEYVGGFVRAIERPSTIARYALNIATENLSHDYYRTYLARLNAVTVEEVQRAAQKYFKIDNARIVITGKGSEVIGKLEEIPYKTRKIPVYYFDKYANQIDKPDFNSGVPEGVNPKTVIDKYIEAIGGAEQVNKIQSLKLVYEGTAMGTKVKTEEKRTADKYSQTTFMNDSPMMGVVSKDNQFFMKQGPNKVPLPPEMQADLEYAMGVMPELGIPQNDKASVTGIEEVDGRDAYRIEVTGEVVNAQFFFDVESGLKVKEVSTITMNGQTQNQEIIYRDYQEYEGVRFPTVKIGNLGAEILESSLLEVVINEEFPESDFE